MSASGERYNPYTIVIILKRIKNENDITNQIYLKLSHQIASLIKRNLFDIALFRCVQLDLFTDITSVFLLRR